MFFQDNFNLNIDYVPILTIIIIIFAFIFLVYAYKSIKVPYIIIGAWFFLLMLCIFGYQQNFNFSKEFISYFMLFIMVVSSLILVATFLKMR